MLRISPRIADGATVGIIVPVVTVLDSLVLAGILHDTTPGQTLPLISYCGK